MKTIARLFALATLAATGTGMGMLGTACSDSATSTDGGSTTSTATGTGTSTSTSTGTGTGTPTPDASTTSTTPTPSLNGCTTYVDRTAEGASREITWGFSVASTPEACMKIKVGQTVTWKGDHMLHPLGAKGGDASNPIKEAQTITFPAAGTFGFVCTAHSTMTGAIVVVP